MVYSRWHIHTLTHTHLTNTHTIKLILFSDIHTHTDIIYTQTNIHRFTYSEKTHKLFIVHAYDTNIQNLHTKTHYNIHIDTQTTQKTKIHTLNGISVSFIREVQLLIIQICVILNVCFEAFVRHLLCIFYNSTNFKITQSWTITIHYDVQILMWP